MTRMSMNGDRRKGDSGTRDLRILSSLLSLRDRYSVTLLTDDSNAETRGCQPRTARRTSTPESRVSADSRFAPRRAGIIPPGLTGETAGSAGPLWIGHRSWPANSPGQNIDRISRAASFRFCTLASCLANCNERYYTFRRTVSCKLA